MRITLGYIRNNTRIPQALGLCSTDTRVASYINEAQQRLLAKGKWWGTYQRYRVCITGTNCLTWPRHVAAVEAVAACNTPITIRDTWFEYIANSVGPQWEPNQWGLQLYDRQNAVVFDDPQDASGNLRAYADVSEDADARILVQGYNENNAWIRTQDNGSWIDGEYINLTSANPTLSVNKFSAITGVIKPETNGIIRLNYYNTTTLVESALGIYEPDETHPTYRRSYVSGLDSAESCGCNTSGDSDCQKTTIHAVVKLDHVPVSRDNDWLILGNVPALKEMVFAIKKEESDVLDQAAYHENKAVQYLQEELSHYRGSGMAQVPSVESGVIFGHSGGNY